MMRRIETTILIIVFALLNIPLFAGSFSDVFIYIPERIAQGQFYRLLTHPFVHVSLYHLLLDGVAFILLYNQLNEKSLTRRMIYLLGIHAAVTVGVTLAMPNIAATSYCGISGIAHGLMAIWSLERMTGSKTSSEEKVEQRIATVIFVGLIVKCIFEVLFGRVFFESMHVGNVGIPVVASHLSGVIGAILVFSILKLISGAKTMNKKISPVLSGAVLLVVVLLLSGCGGYYNRPTAGANMGIFRGNLDNTQSDRNSMQPAARMPFKLAVARVQNTHNYHQKTNGFTVQNASIPNQESISKYSSLQGIEDVEIINKLLTAGYHESDVSIRRAAASLGAEMLYVYTLDTEYDDADWSSAVSLYTLGLAPTVTVEVSTTAMGVLLDTETGYVYGVVQASAMKEQKAAFMTRENAWDQCCKITQKEAFEKLDTEFKALWFKVLNQYGQGQFEQAAVSHTDDTNNTNRQNRPPAAHQQQDNAQQAAFWK